MNKKILLAGPWVGEFGWELFCWQGYIRKKAKNFDKTIVISRTGHDFLYKDFATEFIPYDPPKKSSANSWMCASTDNKQVNDIVNKIKHTKYIDGRKPIIIYNANEKGGLINKTFTDQAFTKYNSNSLDKKVDILIHPRNKPMGGGRNWNKDNWGILVSMLTKRYSVGIIGTHEAFYFDSCEDFRNIPIKDTVSLMNRSKLVIGQSSGPLHLAALSGAEHLVWSEEFNRVRYEKHWNPHKTKVHFYTKGGWNPKVTDIYNEIVKIVR